MELRNGKIVGDPGNPAPKRRRGISSVIPGTRAGLHELHPIKNQAILSHLFGVCGSGPLCNFRLVSKEWYRLSLAPWRSSFPLTIRYVGEADIAVINCNEADQFFNDLLTSQYPLDEFMARLQKPENDGVTKPYRTLVIQKGTFMEPSLVPQAGWNILGQGIQTLNLRNCTFAHTGLLCGVLTETFPNLKSLALEFCLFKGHMVSGDSKEGEGYQEPVNGAYVALQSLSITGRDLGDGEGHPESSAPNWLKLLSIFPQLTGLSLYLPDGATEKALRAVKMIKKRDHRKLPIEDWDLHSLELSTANVTNQIFQLCGELRVPLKFITVRVHPDLAEGVVEEIIQSHRSTLITIVVFCDHPNPIYWNFPFNVELKTLLELVISESLLESLGFLKYTPDLLQLKIMDDKHDKLEPVRNKATKIVSNTMNLDMTGLKLHYLSFFKLYYIVSDDELKCLIKWMPSLHSLTMVLNDKQFGMVCGAWRELSSLVVLGQELTDVGVTGITSSELKVCQADAEVDVAGGTIMPNISLLQGLFRFECWSTKLTDASVTNGFLKLPNLKYLTFYISCTGPEKIGLSEGAKTALSDQSIILDVICYNSGCGCAEEAIRF